MPKVAQDPSATDCDKEALQGFLKSVKNIVKQIDVFYSEFKKFLEENFKISKELWDLVTRYNILNAGPPCIYPMIQKEELLQEMLTKIQELTSRARHSIFSIESKFENLQKLNKFLEKESSSLDWDPIRNPLINGGVNHRPVSDYLEEIIDVLFQFDISITCINSYFAALDIKTPKSYENLMNSFKISTEITELVAEFLIKNVTLVT